MWEIAIKMNLGKLSVGFPFQEFANYLSETNIEMMPITLEHLNKVSVLELHHRDPFDRLIIAQSIAENITIITIDEQFKKYPVKLL